MDETMRKTIKQLQMGNEQAFDQVYQKYAGKLYRTAYLISGNKEDSEDIIQETFVKCYLNCKEITSPEYFEKWLMKIMIRTSWRVVKQRKPFLSSDEILQNDDYAGLAEAIFEDKKTSSPLEQILKQENQSIVMNAINSLDLKLRTVIVLYYYEELSVKEIAHVTGKLEGTIKSRLYTGRMKLKKILDGEKKTIIEVRGHAG